MQPWKDNFVLCIEVIVKLWQSHVFLERQLCAVYNNAKTGPRTTTWKKYTSGPRYWNNPVLVNTGTFLVH